MGRLTYQKAPEGFVAALGELGRRDVLGTWIGGGELAEWVASMAKSTPWVRLILVGDRADVPGLLPAFDVSASRRSDGYGRPRQARHRVYRGRAATRCGWRTPPDLLLSP